MARKRLNTGAPSQTDQSPIADAGVIEIEDREFSFAQWDSALLSLQGYERQGLGWNASGKCNPRPMAELLGRCISPPEIVLEVLANMLAPPASYRGPRFIIEKPKKRTIRQSVGELAQKRNARKKFKELMALGDNFDVAVKEIEVQFSKGRTWVTNAIRVSDDEWLDEISKWMGPTKGPS